MSLIKSCRVLKGSEMHEAEDRELPRCPRSRGPSLLRLVMAVRGFRPVRSWSFSRCTIAGTTWGPRTLVLWRGWLMSMRCVRLQTWLFTNCVRRDIGAKASWLFRWFSSSLPLVRLGRCTESNLCRTKGTIHNGDVCMHTVMDDCRMLISILWDGKR